MGRKVSNSDVRSPSFLGTTTRQVEAHVPGSIIGDTRSSVVKESRSPAQLNDPAGTTLDENDEVENLNSMFYLPVKKVVHTDIATPQTVSPSNNASSPCEVEPVDAKLRLSLLVPV